MSGRVERAPEATLFLALGVEFSAVTPRRDKLRRQATLLIIAASYDTTENSDPVVKAHKIDKV